MKNRKINTIVEFAQAIESGKSIELHTHHYDIWENFDYNSYVWRDIAKFIDAGKVRIKE